MQRSFVRPIEQSRRDPASEQAVNGAPCDQQRQQRRQETGSSHTAPLRISIAGLNIASDRRPCCPDAAVASNFLSSVTSTASGWHAVATIIRSVGSGFPVFDTDRFEWIIILKYRSTQFSEYPGFRGESFLNGLDLQHRSAAVSDDQRLPRFIDLAKIFQLAQFEPGFGNVFSMLRIQYS